jgi:hypothetical protein
MVAVEVELADMLVTRQVADVLPRIIGEAR